MTETSSMTKAEMKTHLSRFVDSVSSTANLKKSADPRPAPAPPELALGCYSAWHISAGLVAFWFCI